MSILSIMREEEVVCGFVKCGKRISGKVEFDGWFRD